MDNPHGGRWGLSRPLVTALAASAALSALAVGMPALGMSALAGWLALGSLAGASVVALALLVRRAGRAASLRQRLPWWLLAAAVITIVGWMADQARTAGSSSDVVDPGHVLVAVLIAAALVLLPAPEESRGGRLRVVLDAATAGFAFAVPVAEVVLPSGSALLPADLGVLVHPVVDVGLATVAVAVLARARRPGGLSIVPLAHVTVGAVLLSATDIVVRQDAPPTLVLALRTVVVLLFAAASFAPPDEEESDRAMAWRERVAVLVPLAPLAVAALVLGGSAVLHQSLNAPTVASAVLLSITLISGGVLARLDSLATERTLEDVVLRRTISLGEREKWFRSLVQNSSDVITVVDVRGVVRFQTPSVMGILGHDPERLVGTRMSHLLRPADGRRFEVALATAARSPGRPLTLELAIWAKSGHWCETETTITSLLHDPDIRGLVLNTRDVSERRRLEEQLTQAAFSDALTGLANRTLFRSKVDAALRVALGPAEVAVLFLDLDGFKAVNDAAGHHIGDELLGLVAKRLLNSVRPHDLVARLGGDEFAILVSGADAEEGATWVAKRIRGALTAPFFLDGRELALSASTGIAVSDSGDETADQLQRNADLAMYRAKNDRELDFVRFEVQMHDALLARVEAERELRQAVSRGDLVLYYQPVVELVSARIIGVEALVRWNHRELGLVPPSDFIDLAEECGLVGEIGRWALQESCRQGVLWQRHAMPGGHFKMAVNVSVRQLEPGLPRMVHDMLAASGLPGRALTLEMTETVLMDRTEEVVDLLTHVKKLGVSIAVDDFGTGYSSLSYLSRFPVDILKIDKSFVAHVGEDSGRGELVRTIVSLGDSLRLDTVAEGIETPDQRNSLEEMGCIFGQGYLFSRPLPPEEIDELLEEQSRAEALTRLPSRTHA